MSVLIIAASAWWFAEGGNIIQLIKWRFKIERIRPFDCPKCLAFWMGLFINFRIITFDLSFTFSPVQAVLCSVLAIFIDKIYQRVK